MVELRANDLVMQAIFDGHLDLGYLACAGREMVHAREDELVLGASGAGPDAPGCVSMATLASSPVRACLGTIFLEPVEARASSAASTLPVLPIDTRVAYDAGSAAQAAVLGFSQLRVYQTWERMGLLQRAKRRHAASAHINRPVLGEQRSDRLHEASPLQLGILLEGADCLREPADIAWWHEQGVVAVGLSWAHSSRYAAGNADARRAADGKSLGLTACGRELVPMLDALGIVHDASHLSDAAIAELFESTGAMVVATHSNCRALLPAKVDVQGHEQANQRHVTDATIMEIARRGGVIGLNLFDAFLLPAKGSKGGMQRATINHAAAHVLHVCEVAGHARCVALGSDMDGGFSRERLPVGLDTPGMLPALLDALARRGMSEADVRGFAWENWARVFGA